MPLSLERLPFSQRENSTISLMEKSARGEGRESCDLWSWLSEAREYNLSDPLLISFFILESSKWHIISMKEEKWYIICAIIVSLLQCCILVIQIIFDKLVFYFWCASDWWPDGILISLYLLLCIDPFRRPGLHYQWWEISSLQPRLT